MGSGMETKSESGIAVVTALLVLMLLSALLLAFVVSLNSDQGLISVDRNQNRAYYGAQAGLEQLTASLGNLFDTNYAPTPAQINALTTTPPVLTGISFVAPGGGPGSGYQIAIGNTTQQTVPTGPYAGLVANITQYTITSIAHTLTSGEVKMQRTLQTVDVPVFQFGIFSQTDLSFFAGSNFNFGGRVNTNGNLFLAEGTGATLTMSDKVTAVGEVIRTNLSNGWATSTNYTGTVNVSTAPGAYRALKSTEGSLVGTLGSAQNNGWTNLSIGTYNGRIRNGRTGATALNLPLVSQGATPIDLIRRPAQNSNENVVNPLVFGQRYFAMASLRILLSDTAADITSLPTVTATAPVQLVGNAPDAPATFYAVAGAAGGNYKSNPNTPLIDGYIKMEMQDQNGVWHDVTNEILALGIAGKDLTLPASKCTDQANAIIRVQRFIDSPANCNNTSGTQYWPNVLYDTREGDLRDNIPNNQATVYLGGVMNYIELDVNNLCRWFTGAIGASGANALNTTGYTVYFSDRRTNSNGGNETGEYGFEDFVNPANANGTPNGQLDTGEDVNGNGQLDIYGETPILTACTGACVASPLDNTARPWTAVTAVLGRENKPLFFRRALKLVNGSSINLGANNGIPIGLAVASENPMYVQGIYNAAGNSFNGAHAGCSLIADAVTLLSSNWNDANSFTSPHNPAGRAATTTSYRAAVIAGKGMSFPQPTGTPQDFGTDGGVHNFLRFLENWGGQTLNYEGAIISLFYNRQAVGLYKYNANNVVYQPPTRGYNFDTDFLTPSLLPPDTPMFRDVNITGFTRLLMANQ